MIFLLLFIQPANLMVKDKRCVQLFMGTHHRAMGHHLPYGITQRYLPPDTSERAPPYHYPDRPVFDLPPPDGQEAELTQVVDYIHGWFICLQTVTHPNSIQAWRRATLLIATKALTTTPHNHLKCHGLSCIVLVPMYPQSRTAQTDYVIANLKITLFFEKASCANCKECNIAKK